MKILDNNEKYGEHVNFIDDNDVFVGYGMGQNCCEEADWYIVDRIIPYTYDWLDDHQPRPDKVPDVSEYNFDPDFFQDVPSDCLDAGEMVVFKLIANDKPDLYLHLYNCHNGYYGHGFEVKHGGETVRSGYL
jgi:hypothetical protein